MPTKRKQPYEPVRVEYQPKGKWHKAPSNGARETARRRRQIADGRLKIQTLDL